MASIKNSTYYTVVIACQVFYLSQQYRFYDNTKYYTVLNVGYICTCSNGVSEMASINNTKYYIVVIVGLMFYQSRRDDFYQ